ncbi:MAG: T9SS type A sorting domain-containing protein, partial [Candidatus Cloacimonetes bacterium]|nr:T9SS type A sorting domain-containing protein [Candidatus Cloacimonadota bacterium]
LGENPATNVSAEISSTDQYITITQNASAYNNVQGGGSATNQTYFEITVDEDCPDGHSANIEMNITSDEDTWVLYFALELNAPVIEFQSVFVDDGSNNILDPGETADIYVTFTNSGGSDATNVLTELSESDPYVTLNTTTHTFTVLSAGAVSTGMFNVTASGTAPIGHMANVDWVMNGDVNFDTSGSFDLVISQVPVLLEEDFTGAYPPDGWTLTGLNPGNWTQSTTSEAGGSSPESKLNWSPSFTGESRLVSPELNTAGSSTLDFEFRHYLNDFSGAEYVLSLRTTSDGGTTWNTAWEINPNGNVGPELIQLEISTPDVGAQDFQIAFVFDGNSFNINYWYIDNIHLEGGQGTALGFIEGDVTLDGGTGDVEDVIITAEDYVTSPDASGYYIIPLPSDTYDVTASLEGYEAVTSTGVQVLPNQTVTENFELTYLQAPEDLTAIANSNDVTLEWDMTAMRTTGEARINLNSSKSQMNRIGFEEANSVEETTRSLTGFKVYRNSVEIAQIYNTSQTTFYDNGLDAGDYSYYVTATYDGEIESLPSNIVEISVTLDAPVNLTAQAQEPDVILNWEAPSFLRSLTGYRVYRDGESVTDVTETTYTDYNVPTGIYTYYVTGLYEQYESDASNEVIVDLTEADDPLIPTNTVLIGNYPNPFNPETKIEFSLLEAGNVDVVIYNIKGEKVKKLVDGKMVAGFHSAVWNGKDDNGKKVASGVYLYRFKTAGIDQTKKMMLIK